MAFDSSGTAPGRRLQHQSSDGASSFGRDIAERHMALFVGSTDLKSGPCRPRVLAHSSSAEHPDREPGKFTTIRLGLSSRKPTTVVTVICLPISSPVGIS